MGKWINGNELLRAFLSAARDTITNALYSNSHRNKFRPCRECAVCLLSKPVSDYYARLSSDCRHANRSVCYGCVYKNLLTVLESNIRSPVICPELDCRIRFSVDEIRHILMHFEDTDLLDKYDTYLTNLLLEDMPEFVWCAHGCGSGQLHLTDGSKVDCIHCGRSTCFSHRIPWHEGVTCDEYDESDLSNDPKSKKYLKRFAKQCPKCRAKIEKNDGCDHMTCSQCETDFCWQCLADFGSEKTLNNYKHQRNCIHFQRANLEPDFYRQYQLRRRSRVCSIS